MKTIIYVMSMLLCVTVFSCSEEDVTGETITNQKEESLYLLQQMNEKNPYSSIGIGHNKLLSKMIDNDMFTTRSEDSALVFKTLVRQGALDYMDSILVEYSAPDSCFLQLEQAYDSIVPLITEIAPQNVHIVAPRELLKYSSPVQRVVTSIEEVIKDTVMTCSSKLAQLNNLYDIAESYLVGDEFGLVAMILSVAANSTEYWHEEFPLYNDPDNPLPNNVIVEMLDEAVSYDVATVYVYTRMKAYLYLPPGTKAETLVGMTASASAVGAIAIGVKAAMNWIRSLF